MKITYKDLNIEISIDEIIQIVSAIDIYEVKKKFDEEERKQSKEQPKEEETGGGKAQTKKAKKVDVLLDGGWKTFESLGKAASAINVTTAWLGKALQLGKTANGFHVREHSEIDDYLSEIEERNKQPYEISRKP